MSGKVPSYLWIILMLSILSCQEQGDDQASESFSISSTDTVSLFGEGFISTRYHVRDMAISPEMDEMYYTLQDRSTGFAMILGSKLIDGEWSEPEVASFSGSYSDLEPAYSPDGSRLYFVSNRPKTEGAEVADSDIWYMERSGDVWDEPINIGAPINTDQHEFYPSVSRDGSVYFTARKAGGFGGEDIYVSRLVDGVYSEPTVLDSAINSARDEFNAYVSPDEDFLIFTSWGRADDTGRGDLYISFKDSLGQWAPAVNMGESINSKYIDYCPFVTADQQHFLFSSDRMSPDLYKNKDLTLQKFEALATSPLNGSTNIYILSFDEVLKLRDKRTE